MTSTTDTIIALAGPILGALSLIYVTHLGFKQKRKDDQRQLDHDSKIRELEAEKQAMAEKKEEEAAQDENIADQVKGFHRTLLEMLKMKQTESQHFQEQILRLQAEIAQLREKHTLLKNSVVTMDMMGDNSPIAFWIKDLEGNRIYHNKAYQDMTGFVFEKCFGKNDFEITGDKRLADNWKVIDQRVIKTKMPAMAVELAAHIDRPGEYFEVLTWKWPKLYKTRESEHVIGVEGAAVRVDQIEAVFNQVS